jgi:hypothetical protein
VSSSQTAPLLAAFFASSLLISSRIAIFCARELCISRLRYTLAARVTSAAAYPENTRANVIALFSLIVGCKCFASFFS